jgi:protein-disulfide isomerase
MRPVRRQVLVGAVALAVAGPTLAAPAPGDMTIGDPKASVEVVEYLSLTCPHCAEFNEKVFPAVKAKYIDTGKVRWTFRELLTPPAQVAGAGFLLARCAGPPKYAKVVDEILRSQPRWTSGSIKPIFVEIGKANGVSEEQFNACLGDQAAITAMEGRIQYAVETDKVNSTPTFFVNGQRLEGDHVPTLAQMEAAIAAAAKSGRR